MRILAVDVGGATQDILLFDGSLPLDNCVQMIMPSPTIITGRHIEAATARKRPVLLTGVNMGGGPIRRAMRKHIAADLPFYATADAAATFNDDLAEVQDMGVTIVSPDEALAVVATKDVRRIEARDVDLAGITRSLAAFGIRPGLDGIAVAVQDHGAAPPGVSDRRFRFEHLKRSVERDASLETFAYLRDDIPPYLTRMQAVARSLPSDIPLLLMDTGPAAVLGALEDRTARSHGHCLVANAGNFHTLAFHLRQNRILAILEHHTSALNAEKLDSLLDGMVRGTLTNDDVFNDGGHGCLILAKSPGRPFLTLTGPRRSLATGSRYRPYLAAPHGDMMLTGCYGLLRGFAHRMAAWREQIDQALSS